MVSWQIPVSALELWKQTWRLLSFQSQEEPGRCRERAGLDNKARSSGTAKKGFYTLSSAEGCLSVSHHERRVLHWWSVQGSCVFSSLEKVENREGRQFSTLCDCPGSQGHRTGQVRSEEDIIGSLESLTELNRLDPTTLKINGFSPCSCRVTELKRSVYSNNPSFLLQQDHLGPSSKFV